MNLTLVNIDNFKEAEINTPSLSNHPAVQQNKLEYQDVAFGKVCCSWVTSPNITLFSGLIHLNQAVRLKTSNPENSINFPFLLEGSIASSFYSYPEKQHLLPNSHNAIHLVNAEGEHLLPKGEIQTFHLSLDANYFFNHFTSDDRITDRIKNSIYLQKPQVASKEPGFINPEMKSIIKSLKDNPYKDGLKAMFLEIKTLELITIQFHQFLNHSQSKKGLTPKDRELAFGLKELLEANYLYPWTLDDLAKQFCTNIQTLKMSFKGVFGISIFSFYQQLRMNYAKELICSHGMQIAEIADILGYSHQNHFSTAFKKKFGYPPSALKSHSGFPQ